MKNSILKIGLAAPLMIFTTCLLFPYFLKYSALIASSITIEPSKEISFINVLNNSTISWRFDSISPIIANYTNSFLSHRYFYLILLSILFYFGSLTLASLSFKEITISQYLSIGLVNIGLLLAFGSDSTVLGILINIIWVSIALLLLASSKIEFLVGLFISLVLLIFINYCIPQFSFLIISLGLISFCLVKKSGLNFRTYVLLAIVASLSYFSSWHNISYQTPDYPALSHVVPDDNVPGNIMPLIGPAPQIPLINRNHLKKSYSDITIILLLISLTLLLTKNNSLGAYHEFGFISLISFFLLVECSLPEHIALASPLAAVSRVLPGLFFYCITPLLIAALIIFLVNLCIKYSHNYTLFISIILFAALLFLSSKMQSLLIDSRTQYQNLLLLHQQKKIDENEFLSALKILASPSFPVIHENGLEIILERSQLSKLNEISPNIDGALLFTSHNSNERDLKRITDGRASTRWSAGRGDQEGDEYIEIMLNAPIEMRGVLLELGNYPADFPRGLRVMGSQFCNFNAERISANYSVLYESHSFQGSIRYTNDGYPYYGAQSDVRIFFKENQVIQCLKFEQISKDNNYDWSIAELKFLQTSN